MRTFQNVVELAVRASALKAGVDPESIEFVKLPFPDMPAALSSGRADAVFVVEPFQQVVPSQGENPDLVNCFTEAMNESLAYANSHPDEVRRVLPTYTKIGPEVIPNLVLPKWPPGSRAFPARHASEAGRCAPGPAKRGASPHVACLHPGATRLASLPVRTDRGGVVDLACGQRGSAGKLLK